MSEVLRILVEVGAAQRLTVHRDTQRRRRGSRVPDDATAYAHRQAELMFATTTVGPHR